MLNISCRSPNLHSSPRCILYKLNSSSEKANLAISLASTVKNDILGHMAFLDYPCADSVDPTKWEQWLKEHYTLAAASVSLQMPADSTHQIIFQPLNSLFVHLFVAKDAYQRGACKEILR